ncbi:MAG: ABC transporter ATP-binding protein, partial [Planctomycetota bacterium]
QTTVVLGESGGGNSVFLKTLVGLVTPDEGEILYAGHPVQSLSEAQWLEHRQKISYVFQWGALFDSLNVFDNVAFPLRERRVPIDRIKARVEEELAHVGLPDVSHMMPSSLSGGMRKRVALARSLVLDPELILYDEPTTGLDPVMTAQISQLIRSTQDRHAATSIVVTHDMQSATAVADNVVMLFEGRVHFQGTRDELMSTPDPVVRQFVSGSASGPINPVRARN